MVSVVTGNGHKGHRHGATGRRRAVLVKPEMGALLSAFGARDIRP